METNHFIKNAVIPESSYITLFSLTKGYNHGKFSVKILLKEPLPSESWVFIYTRRSGVTNAILNKKFPANVNELVINDLIIGEGEIVYAAAFSDSTFTYEKIEQVIVYGTESFSENVNTSGLLGKLLYNSDSSSKIKHELYRFNEPTSVYSVVNINITSITSSKKSTPIRIRIWLTDNAPVDDKDKRGLILDELYFGPYFHDTIKNITLSQGLRLYVNVENHSSVYDKTHITVTGTTINYI